MKILVIEYCNYVDYPIGGHLSFVRNMLRAFGDDLMLVGITTDGMTPGVWGKRTIDGVEYDYFPVCACAKNSSRPLVPARIRSFLAVRKYRRKILARPCDLIFIQTPEVLLALPPKARASCILRMPGVGNPLRNSRYRFFRHFQSLYDRIFFRAARQVRMIWATANEREIDRFVARSRGTVDKRQLVQYPTRYDGAIYRVRDRSEMRRRLGIDSGATVVVTVGRLGWFKGWKLMLDAFALFRQAHPEALFVYIGDGEDRPKIEDYILRKQLGESVLMTGRLLPARIAEYLGASDLFVMGSFQEGWATTLVEACASAVPCVVTDFSSSEMVVDGENGYVVRDRDERSFAERMELACRIPRDRVIAFDRRYEQLSVQRMKHSFAEILKFPESE